MRAGVIALMCCHDMSSREGCIFNRQCCSLPDGPPSPFGPSCRWLELLHVAICCMRQYARGAEINTACEKVTAQLPYKSSHARSLSAWGRQAARAEEEQELQRQAERLRARQDIQAQLQQRGAAQGAAQARRAPHLVTNACRAWAMWHTAHGQLQLCVLHARGRCTSVDTHTLHAKRNSRKPETCDWQPCSCHWHLCLLAKRAGQCCAAVGGVRAGQGRCGRGRRAAGARGRGGGGGGPAAPRGGAPRDGRAARRARRGAALAGRLGARRGGEVRALLPHYLNPSTPCSVSCDQFGR